MVSHAVRVLFVAGAVVSVLSLTGCRGHLLLRLPEPRGAHQTTPVDPKAVDGLAPWVEDKDAGLVSSVPALDLRSYTVLVVEPFTVNAADIIDEKDRRVSEEVRRELHAKLLSRLRGAAVFARLVDGQLETAPTVRVLRLSGEISRFTLGSRSLRLFIGFGAGRTKLQVETRFVDADTGQAVLALADRRVASKGLFGGDARAFLLDSVDGITRALAASLKRRTIARTP